MYAKCTHVIHRTKTLKWNLGVVYLLYLVNLDILYPLRNAIRLHREADKISVHESVDEELQADLFVFLGQVFLPCISVMLGLIMITHLGAGSDKTGNTSRQPDGSRANAG